MRASAFSIGFLWYIVSMQFFESIKDSIYGPDYYRGLLRKPFSYSLKYYFSLVLVLAFVVTLVLSFSVVPAVNTFLKSAAAKVLEYYPAELQIRVMNGTASTNVAEPYVLPLPEELKTQLASGAAQDEDIPKDIVNLLVIDTKNPFTVEAFKNFKTLSLLTKDNFIYLRKGAITIHPLDKISDYTLNKAKVQSFVAKVKPYLAFISPLIVLVLFMVFAGMFGLELLYLVLFALVVWGIARVRNIQVGYGKSYQLGLHLITVALILDAIGILFQAGVRYLPTAIMIILAALNLRGSSVSPAENSESSGAISS